MELREYIGRQIAETIEASQVAEGSATSITAWDDLQAIQRELSMMVADGLLIRIPELYNIVMNRNTERQIQD